MFQVEFNSHYGKEHFCCTSLIRVYGTSEFEVLETENEVHSAVHDLDDEVDEDEQPIGADMGKPAKNLFGHATDAVRFCFDLNFVCSAKISTKVLLTVLL